MRKRILGIGAIALLGSVASADVVLDQLDFVEASQHGSQASQDFTTVGNDPFDIITIDDFTVTATQTRIQNVEAIMSGFNGFVSTSFTDGTILGYRVEFYTSLAAAGAGMVGDAGSTVVSPGAITVNALGWGGWPTARHIVLPVDVTLASAGTYWMGVAAIMPFASGQTGVHTTNLPLGGQNGEQANAAGGFGFPGNISGGFGATLDRRDVEYKIEGFDPVPEPASMIALGLGAAALAARRRRKKA